MTNLTLAIERWSELPADVVRRPPVVLITDNYDRLFYEPDAIARSARYSHYIDDTHMLRTHTTAAIPALLAETKSERLIVCPGLVYRRDVVDPPILAVGGAIAVPDSPGLGIEPVEDVIRAHTLRSATLHRKT